MGALSGLVLLLQCLLLFVVASTAFVVERPLARPRTNLDAKKKGGSMAEKRKRRQQARQQRRQAIEDTVATLPKSKLDFKTPPAPPSPTQPPPQQDDETQSKAKELVESQRESVQMLTHVTEQMQAKLQVDEVTAALESNGYYVVDDFLKEEVVQQLQKESESLFLQDEMTADVLGTGEFIVAIEGGADQYPKCPRSIEWVVSVTSKLAAILNSKEGAEVELDDRACSRAMARVFDRSALKASLKLLLLGDHEDQKMVDALQNLTPPPFQLVLDPEEDAVDLRKVSVSYFLVPEAWDASCGGHLSFQKDEAVNTIEAQRNRLVLWKSDTTLVRREPFRGSEETTMAGGLELHLVEKQQQELKK